MTVVTPLAIALALVALGGAGLLLHNSRLTLGALAVQWLGLAMAAMAGPGGTLQLTRGAAVELATAIVCVVLLWVTLRTAERTSTPHPAPVRPVRRYSPADYAVPAAVLLLGGIAGVGFASLFPLGENTQVNLVFYWSVIAPAIVIILDGARDPVKAALALLGLLNSAALLVLWLGVTAPATGLLGLLAVSRIALALVLGYGWVWLKEAYGELSLEPLFGRRDEELSTALVVVAPPVTDGKPLESLNGTVKESVEERDIEHMEEEDVEDAEPQEAQ